MGILKKELRPEFINRIDEINVFKKLSEIMMQEMRIILIKMNS